MKADPFFCRKPRKPARVIEPIVSTHAPAWVATIKARKEYNAELFQLTRPRGKKTITLRYAPKLMTK